MAHYPQTRGFTGVLRPLRLEGDINDLEIDGTVPPELNGSFHRVHPDAQFPPRFADDQFFNGDGLISLFRFASGRISLRQRYAQTDKWKVENQAGRALFGAYRNPLTDDPSVEGMIRGTANTTPIVHAGKLWALKEDSPPLLMDPLTLATQGYTNFGGKMKGQTFTAHPKIDPASGNLCAFGYASKGLLTPDCTYMEVDTKGTLLFETFFQVPYYCMMHDFAITDHYAIFHIVPIVSSWERLKAGLPHFGFNTRLAVWLGVLPRKGQGKDIRWFKAPETVFASHVMNAFEDGTRLHFDIPQARNNSFPFFPDIDGAPFDTEAGLPYLHRWTVDLGKPGEALPARLDAGDGPGGPLRRSRRPGVRIHHEPDRPYRSSNWQAGQLVGRSAVHRPGAAVHCPPARLTRRRRLHHRPGRQPGHELFRSRDPGCAAPGGGAHRAGEAAVSDALGAARQLGRSEQAGAAGLSEPSVLS